MGIGLQEEKKNMRRCKEHTGGERTQTWECPIPIQAEARVEL